MSNFNLKFAGNACSIKCNDITVGQNPAQSIEDDWVDGTTEIDLSSYEKVVVGLTNNGGAWNINPGESVNVRLLTPYTNGSSGNNPSKFVKIDVISSGGDLVSALHNYPSGSEAYINVQIHNVTSSAYTAGMFHLQVYYI